VASTAPAYSLASSLGFVVVLIGVSTPVVTILAFVPTLLISLGYKELNRADPTVARPLPGPPGRFPQVGWMGGWGLWPPTSSSCQPRPDRRQYVFLLFDAKASVLRPAADGYFS